MKFNCLFCGKEVEGDPITSEGFCEECELAKNFAEITRKELHKPIITVNGKQFDITEEEMEKFEKKLTDIWINSLLYGEDYGKNR